MDFRSDTVTKPSLTMREAMSQAVVGDDVYKDDPTVNALEKRAANLLGKEAALFVSSGTQSNLLAMLSHCGRGEEYIAGQSAHVYKYEAGGAAVLGSIQPQPLPLNSAGEFDLEEVEKAIKVDDFHFAKTKLLCIENTTGGYPLSLDYLDQVRTFVQKHNLALHLDGARLGNAAIYHSCSIADLAQGFDSVSLCLSKGLGAPIGSILAGPANFIEQAMRWRKMLGGGWRQAGILAAAANLALDNIDRLQEDHDNAKILAEGLNNVSGFTVDLASVKTNIFFLEHNYCADKLQAWLKDHDITVGSGQPLRMVTHQNISTSDISKALSVFAEFSKQK